MKDAHLHLTDKRINAEEIIASAKLKGVDGFLSCSAKPDEWRKLESLLKSYPEVIGFFGVHPWYINDISKSWQSDLESLLKENPKACVGEIGLDKAKPDYEKQKDVFIKQLELAKKYKRLTAIHSVRAHDDILDILKQHKKYLPPLILHSYSAPLSFIKPFRELGCYFSISPFILKKDEEAAAEILLSIPEDRLLIETDAPDGLKSPELLSGFIMLLANIMGWGYIKLENTVTANIERLIK